MEAHKIKETQCQHVKRAWRHLLLVIASRETYNELEPEQYDCFLPLTINYIAAYLY